MAKSYLDLREYLEHLKSAGKLRVVERPIDKDQELAPLVRWQFRGLAENQRTGWWFTNVTDARNRKYNGSVAVAVIGASREVYSLAMGCEEGENPRERWLKAQLNPVAPVLVGSGPVQEEIHHVEEIAQEGLEEFPIPIFAPGFDCAPFITSPFVFTKDPDTGIRNVGTYRAMLKGKNLTGISVAPAQHIGTHWAKYKEQGRPMEAAIVIGGPPGIAVTSVTKLPYGMDEVAVAGGFAGRPIEMVRCQTVDLEVPAYAEIVLEGEITTDCKEIEGPYGEYTGYLNSPGSLNPLFKIRCITHRKNPVFQGFMCHYPPSESGVMRKLGYDATVYKLLKYDMGIEAVQDVAFHEAGGVKKFCVIQMHKRNPAEAWQALHAAAAFDANCGKVIVAVDDDIDPNNLESVIWAISFRMQPHQDLKIITHRYSNLDPSSAPPGATPQEGRFPMPTGCSGVLIDATRKWPYPTVALPRKDFMEKAKKIWEELGLEPLEPRSPWHGYTLGAWSAENDEEAMLALEGRYEEVAKNRACTRVKV